MRLVVGLQQPVAGEIVLENPPDGISVAEWGPRLVPVALPEWWLAVEGTVNASRQFAFEGVSRPDTGLN